MQNVMTSLTTGLFAYALMAVVAMLCAVLIWGLVKLLARVGDRQAKLTPTPVLVSVTPARDESAAVAAAIAAAVYAMIGAHRLVYIGEARSSFGWTSEIRSRLHTSHAPRQTGR